MDKLEKLEKNLRDVQKRIEQVKDHITSKKLKLLTPKEKEIKYLKAGLARNEQELTALEKDEKSLIQKIKDIKEQ